MSVTPPPFSNFQFGIFMLGLAQNKPSPAPNSHWTKIYFLVINAQNSLKSQNSQKSQNSLNNEIR